LADTRNPFQVPEADLVSEESRTLGSATAIREEHIKHEASVKAIGWFNFLMAAIFAGLAFVTFRDGGGIAAASIAVCFAVLVAVAGYGVRKLFPWGRWLNVAMYGFMVVSAFAALATGGGFGGLLIPIFVLIALLGRKSKMVFSPEYKEIIAATPEIKYRSPRWIYVLLGLLVLVLVIILVAVLALG